MFNCKDYNIETTLGQLSFFKWALDNMILEYITENYNHIEIKNMYVLIKIKV